MIVEKLNFGSHVECACMKVSSMAIMIHDVIEDGVEQLDDMFEQA